MSVLRWYLNTSLVLRVFAGFFLGVVGGIALWLAGPEPAQAAAAWIAPFGTVFVAMLKAVVVPVVAISLVTGAAALPLKRFGWVGVKVIAWYLLTSLAAALVGVGVAMALQPGRGAEGQDWQRLADALGEQAGQLASSGADASSLGAVFLGMFTNPFAALSSGDFLPVIVASLAFGLGIRVLQDEDGEHSGLDRLVEILEALRGVVFRVVDWVLEVAPVGVLALTAVNFGLYGPDIVGPYVAVVAGVLIGVAAMMLVVYPVLILAVLRENPLRALGRMREAVLTAFVTRSSAATLPVSLRVARQQLGIRRELSSFSLPLGATLNMDGVCVHLPVFAVLAANLFGLELGASELLVLVLTTVLAAIGAGGVPGGSLMLLFIILGSMGLSGEQVATVVALALGVNPILDMFETMNNVTGDLVCTYVVAGSEGLRD